jgi:tRNA-specific 2-thiouridylase
VSERVVVAMSGGVDSSVAAALLAQAGHTLVGVTLQLHDCHDAHGSRSCCGSDGITRAREVAALLGFPHYVLGCAEDFERQVLLPAWQEYAAGRTPSPCLLCNQRVKLGVLAQWALRLGIGRVATGHYARLERDADGRLALRRGCDAGKDQSYFLAGLSLAQLERALFPIGHLDKREVRALARRLGLPTALTPESQDACLVAPGESFAEMLRVRFAAPARRGEIVDESGRVVGEHDGIHLFTVGQRKGLPAGATARRWVKAIVAERGRIVVTSDPGAILGTGFAAAAVSWLVGEPPAGPLPCEVQIRYRHPSVPATVRAQADGSLAVTLGQPVKAITPGQAAVFYDGDRVLGQGWIASPRRDPTVLPHPALR